MKGLSITLIAGVLAFASLRAVPANQVLLNLDASPAYPRDDEGSFASLPSGRILYCYSQFYGGRGDFSSGRIAEIHSDDGGQSWSQPRVIVEKGDKDVNAMSVSLLGLARGKLAMFYLIKENACSCHPYMRVSTDGGATWSAAVPIVRSRGYWELHNDRAVQTRRGRIILPLAFYRTPDSAESSIPEKLDQAWWDRTFEPGRLRWYFSDDEGATWQASASTAALPAARPSGGLEEPGVVELADGSLFSWARTDRGMQFGLRSGDGGKTWTAPQPTQLMSPYAPASIRRLPGSRTLLAVYCDHSGRFPFAAHAPNSIGGRTPLVAALSYDDGRTWPVRRVIEGDPAGWYGYTAIHFLDDAVLLAYNNGTDRPAHFRGIRIRRLALSCLR